MDDFVNVVNRFWETTDEVSLCGYVLWRLNYIHPFINGNGRTARVATYLVLCLKMGTWLPGTPILPELIRANRADYFDALARTDALFAAKAVDWLTPMHTFLQPLIATQFNVPAPPTAVIAP